MRADLDDDLDALRRFTPDASAQAVVGRRDEEVREVRRRQVLTRQVARP